MAFGEAYHGTDTQAPAAGGGGFGSAYTSSGSKPKGKKKGGLLSDLTKVAKWSPPGITARVAWNLGSDIKHSTIPAIVGIADVGKAIAHDSTYSLLHGGERPDYKLAEIGKATAKGYGQVYGGVGDIYRGDVTKGLKRLGNQFINHPLQPILDGLTVMTLGGAGAARLGTLGALGERGAALGKPGVKVFNIGEEALPPGVQGPTYLRQATLPTSKNPWTRAVQNLNHSVLTRGSARLESLIGREWRYGEAARGRRIEIRAADRRSQTKVHRDLKQFDDAFRGLKPRQQVALSLAAQGLDPASAVAQGLKPTAYRDMVQAGLEEARADLLTAKTRSSKADLRVVEKAHERMLGYLDQIPPALYDEMKQHPAFEAADALMGKMREDAAALNILDLNVAKDRPYLSARILGGARYTPYQEIAQKAMEAMPERQSVHAFIDEFTPDEYTAKVFKQGLDDRIRYFAARAGESPEEIIAATDAMWKSFDTKAVKEQFIPENTASMQNALFQESMDVGTAGQRVEKVKPETTVKREDLIAKHRGDLPDAIDHNALADRILQAGVKLPDELMQPGALAARLADVYENVKAGANGRYWYDTAADISRWISENDPAARKIGVTPEQVAQMIAVFSQSADTVANMAFLRKALDQYAEHKTVYAGIFPERQHVEILKILKGEPWEGRKRSSFYMNIIEKLNPGEHAALMKQRADDGITSSDAAAPVTVDRWVTRWFIPGKDVPGAYYDAFERAIQEMAGALGWQPKEVQAAAWVATKQMSLAERHPKWTLAQVEKAGEDAYNVGFDKYFSKDQGRLDTGAKILHPAADRAANLANRPGGGGTLKADLSPANYKTGYMVSHGAFEQVTPAPIKGLDVEAYRSLHEGALKDKTNHIGIWHNPDNSTIYFDLSRRFTSKEEALAWGREQGQLTVGDMKGIARLEKIPKSKRTGADYDRAFPPTGLSETEANVIKSRLKDEHFGAAKPLPVNPKTSLTPNPNSAVERWQGIVEKTAQEVYGAGKKPNQQQLSAAERYLDDLMTKRPDDPTVQKLQDLQETSLRERNAPDPEDLFQRADALEGLPAKGNPSPEVQGLARSYMDEAGLPYEPPRTYREVDPEEAAQFAREYDDMLDMHDPNATPEYRAEVQRAYDAMASETLAQAKVLEDAGYTFEFYPPGESPYPSPWDAMRDLQENKHLYVFPTSEGFGTLTQAQKLHPLLQDSGIRWGGQVWTHNDVFRAVHDVFGHFKEGVGFRAAGEDNAWRSHAAMFSPEARRAMTTETRGQNSWVNYGPHAEHNLKAGEMDTIYADQKAGLLPEYVSETGRLDPPGLAQDVGISGGRARGAFIPTGSFGGKHHIQIAKSGAVDTLVHEFGHLMETWLKGDPLEKNVAAHLLDRNGKRLIAPDKDGNYTWTLEAKEQFAKAVMAWERQRHTPLGYAMRKLYGPADLPDIDPAFVKTLNEIHRKRTLEGGKLHGGLSVQELQDTLGKLIYHPHVGKTLREGTIPQRAAGEGVVNKPDLVKLNKGIRLQTSQWLPHPSVWKDAYLKVIGYSNAVARHEYAWKIGKPVGENMERNEGWFYVRESRTLPTRAQREAEGLNKAYKEFDDANDLEKYVDENLSTKSEDMAKQWAGEGYGVRQISPVAHKQLFGEFKAVGAFFKKYDKVTDFWRTLTLTYRPAWVVNNFVGQTLLYAANHAFGGGSLKAYAAAVLEEMKGRSTLPEDLRYGLFKTEAPQIHAAFNRFTRTEARMRDSIQRFNAALSDNVPRNATYKVLINKMAKTNDLAGELRTFVKDSMGNTEKMPKKLQQIHDDLVQQVLDELIDFSNLSNFERTVVRRAIPFYSWIKGIMRATARFGFHHPARALILMLLAQDGERVTARSFGIGAPVVEGFLPIGKPSADGLQGGLNTAGLNPWATVGQTEGQIAALFRGGGSPLENPILSSNPILQAAITAAAGVDLFSRKAKDQGRLVTFANELLHSTPEADLIAGLISPQNGPRKLSPQTRATLALRYMGVPYAKKRISVAKSLSSKPVGR